MYSLAGSASYDSFYDSFDSSTNTFGAQITEAERNDVVYVRTDSANYTLVLQVKNAQTNVVLTTGLALKKVGSSYAVFSFAMPSANIKIEFTSSGNGPIK